MWTVPSGLVEELGGANQTSVSASGFDFALTVTFFGFLSEVSLEIAIPFSFVRHFLEEQEDLHLN